ncbi:SusC/RagA family TonB-linked outer membrane protein [Filimonas effusa]|uniref:SusC/RagA family TonB-linked outer membrane protein n=1 Tax=Filimonas effusa TaxID=2508721 RepID=A0A4Q1D4F2_9BACT|nr:SusC/RagA family TonB-linked outer membrane protein [Filimonas effusa]RXK83320.1 SusC/RagA family TonB-linked outer membrane protein [Filimonas effusa]
MKPILLAWAFGFFVAVPVVSYSQEKSESSSQSAAIKKTITGTIKDDKGVPLENAVIEAKGGGAKVMSQPGGLFKIDVPVNATTLIASHVGMANLEIKLEGKSAVDIVLQPSNTSLNDVIVVGYSQGTRKRDNPFATPTIKGSEIQDLPVPNVAAALRGRIVGLGVSATSGKPGSAISLNIRNSAVSTTAAGYGVTTEPLYVIDNIIVDKAVFDALDPTMIEDLTILKDAAAAMYGASGSKGVVLITTKRGKAGPTKFSYTGFAGVNDATKMPEMLSAYELALAVNQSNRYAYKQENEENIVFSDSSLNNYLKNLNYKSWIDEIWQPSLTQRHSLNMSGGSDRVTFAVGGGYQSQNGNYANIKADKYTLRSNLSAKLGKGFRTEINFNVDNNIRKSQNPKSPNDQDFLDQIYTMPRWVPYTINGNYVNPMIGKDKYDNIHPGGMASSGFYTNENGRSYGINAALIYQPESGWLQGLTVRFQASQTGSNATNATFTPGYQLMRYNMFNTVLYKEQIRDTVIANADANSKLERSQSQSSGYRFFVTVQYQKSIGDHKFSIMGTGEQAASKGSGMSQDWRKQNIPGFDEPWAFETASPPSATMTEATKRSYLTNFSYSYKGKYSITGITRFDASSNFAKGKIWGVAPTVGVGWVMSDERFFRNNVNFIDFFKVRASLGLTGDDRIDARLWQERFKVNKESYYWGGAAVVPGLQPQIIPNPDITWERKRTLNVGFEIGLIRNRLNLGIEFFQSYGYDAFDKGNDKNYPMYAGFTAPVMNYMQRYNWGSEYSISYNQPFRNDWNLKASVNFGFGNSRITQMFINSNNLWINYPDDWQYQLGTDPRVYNTGNFGLIAQGMFKTQDEVDAFLNKNPGYTIYTRIPQPGWLYFKDINGDGVITAADKTLMFKRTDPKIATNAQFSVSHKAFTVNVNIAARFGGKEFYDSKIRKERPTAYTNVSTMWKDQWSPDNPNGRFPRGDDPTLDVQSDFWAVDGTMIRVNDMTISYTLPVSLTRKAGLSGARLVLTGNNLWVLKNPLPYKDPYSSYIYDYPTLRTISLGVNLSL